MELDVMLRAVILLPAGQTGGVVSVVADAAHMMAGRRSGIKSNGRWRAKFNVDHPIEIIGVDSSVSPISIASAPLKRPGHTSSHNQPFFIENPAGLPPGQFCVARLARIPYFSRCSIASRIFTGTHQESCSRLSKVKPILSSTWTLRRFLGVLLGTLRLSSVSSLGGLISLRHGDWLQHAEAS